jgi:hypothetical protein
MALFGRDYVLHNTQKLLRVNPSKRFQAQSTGESEVPAPVTVDVDPIIDFAAETSARIFHYERKKALP